MSSRQSSSKDFLPLMGEFTIGWVAPQVPRNIPCVVDFYSVVLFTIYTGSQEVPMSILFNAESFQYRREHPLSVIVQDMMDMWTSTHSLVNYTPPVPLTNKLIYSNLMSTEPHCSLTVLSVSDILYSGISTPGVAIRFA